MKMKYKMEYYRILTMLIVLICQRVYADTTVDISIGYDITSTHDQDDVLQCCFKLTDDQAPVSLTLNVTTAESTVMLYDNVDKSYTVYRDNNLLLQDSALLQFDTSNRSVIHISANSTFTWICGTELPVDICLNNSHTQPDTASVLGVTQTTDITTKHEEVTSNPITSPGGDIYKIIIAVLSAVILVLVVIILAVIIHYKRKSKANINMQRKLNCTNYRREQSYLEDVIIEPGYRNREPEYRTMELHHETMTTHDNTVQSNHNVNSCDSNQNSLSNANNEGSIARQNEQKSNCYGPTFHLCQPQEETTENIRATATHAFLNKTYAFVQPKNEQHVQQRTHTKSNSDEKSSSDSENLSDGENDDKHEVTAAQHKQISKPKRQDHRETIHVIPGKNNPIILLRSAN